VKTWKWLGFLAHHVFTTVMCWWPGV